MIKIGCCGFCVPQKDYFKNFKVIEIQKTFYQLPKKDTALKWKEQAPSDFEFTLKAWQIITHPADSPTYRKLNLKINKKNIGFFKPTTEVFEAWQKTEEIARFLGAKVIVFQCPASFVPNKKNIDNLKKFFKKIKRKDYIFCWEPRGNWQEELIKELCKELNLVHCVDPFKDKPLFGEINYFRLHGKTGYNYKYTNEDLIQLKDFIDLKTINYIMFNNVYMFEDALRFKEMIHSSLSH